MIQVKLFHVFTEYPKQETTQAVKDLENQMNEFLKGLKDEQVKKIYVAIDSIDKMGLVEYVDALSN